MQQLDIPIRLRKQVCLVRQPLVFAADRLRSDLKVLSWELLPPPKFGRCRLAVQGLSAAPVRMEDMPGLPSVGTQICIQPTDGSDTQFWGVVVDRMLAVIENSEELVIDVASQLAESLALPLDQRYVLADGNVVSLQKCPIKFNAGQGTLASPDEQDVGQLSVRVFDSSLSAQRWTVADAIRYLIATSMPSGMSATNADELPKLCGGIDAGECDVTSLTLIGAIVELSHRAGLEVRASRDELGIVFYQPGTNGRRRSLRLQPAGSTLDLAASNIAHGSLSLGRRPAGATVLCIGGPKQYESTFVLQAGWDGSLESSRWRDFVVGQSPDWPGLADVFRKWVLNEHGWYDGEPWSLSRYDFSDIDSTAFAQPVPRKFLPCISSDVCGKSLGVVVEYRCDDGPWQRWSNPVWVSSGECAVYLGGDGLPADYFRACVDGDISVRVTACVAADAHLTAEASSGDGGRRMILAMSHRACWRKVHSSSIFFGADGIGQPSERDDTKLLQNLAQVHADSAGPTVRGELALGWIDTSFGPGDIIAAIEGRELALNCNTQSLPAVRSVRHDFSRRYCTILTVSG